MGGTIRNQGATPIAIGGTSDHVHLLVGLRGTHALADVVRDVKTVSSKWIKETYGLPPFGWQDGYAGLSVGWERKNKVVEYIANQEEHHRVGFAVERRIGVDPRRSGGSVRSGVFRNRWRLCQGLGSSRPSGATGLW